MNYGIVWLMIRDVGLEEYDNFAGVRLYCRGLLANKLLIISSSRSADIKKLQSQLKIYVQTYNKTPVLGFRYEVDKKPVIQASSTKNTQIEQLQSTKINLVRRKNVYTTSQGLGSIQDTEFNAQLGLMMQKFPQGVTRVDLWQIFK